MQKLLLFLGISCLVISCDKNRNKQYSTWYINEQSFSSRDVTFDIGKGGLYMAKAGTENGFNMGWASVSRPRPGYLPISQDTVSHNPERFGIAFYQHGAYYRLSYSNPDSLLVSEVNGKLRFELAPAWFINYFNPEDSVLIKGTFNEP